LFAEIESIGQLSQVSNSFLLFTAYQGRRLAVVTDHGIQLGYLLGLDERQAVLFGPYARKDAETFWTVIIVPRTVLMYAEEVRITDEPDEQVREKYARHAKGFLDSLHAHFEAMDASTTEEDVQ
jgi:hypothetical protein